MTTLYEQAEELLEATKTALLELGASVPARQIIYPPPIPVDCEQIAVLISGYTPQPPWEGSMPCPVDRWFGIFQVTISRKTDAVPVSRSAPAPALMNGVGLGASTDCEALTRVVAACGEVGPELLIETTAPQGGYYATVMNIHLPVL